ncbi:MFS transporter [Buchananella hordeovulneris]|uniref:MFS transporter n=1 Tax=Buchananella hordeovulneris TaxID=52770 RepID=UPI0026DD717A|nr:MFS transporter [Buchananella hordeovulneris]MDO5081123.1 MFS transporter [Buchananella hordeovulneris]
MNTISFLWRQRALALIAVATILTSASFVVPVSTLYLLARGLTYPQIFTLETVLVVSIMVCDLPTGRLADRSSDRLVLVSGYVIGAAAAIGYAASTTYGAFVLANILSGLAIALVSGADRSYLTSVLADESERRLTGVLGHFGALESVAGAVAGVAGGLLATRGITWPAVAAAGAETLGAVVVLWLPPARRPVAADEPAARVPLLAVARQVLATPVLWLTALQPWILVGAAFYLNQPRWQATGIPLQYFGVVLALAQVAAALGSHVAESLARRFGSPTAFVAATTLATAAGFGLLAVPHGAATVAGFIVVLAASAARGPVAGALATLAAPARTRATTLSLVTTCGSLIGVAVNPLVGLLSQHSVTAACWAVAGVLGGFALAWARLRPPAED